MYVKYRAVQSLHEYGRALERGPATLSLVAHALEELPWPCCRTLRRDLEDAKGRLE